MIIRYDVKARYQIEEIFQYGKSNFGSQTALAEREHQRIKTASFGRKH